MQSNLALGASIGIQLTMLPVSLYFFGEVSLVGIFLNLLVLPTVGVVLGSGVIGLLAGCVSFSVGRVVIFLERFLSGIYEELCNYLGICLFGIWDHRTTKAVAGGCILYFVCRSSLDTYTEREEGEKNNCFRSCMPGHVYSYMA